MLFLVFVFTVNQSQVKLKQDHPPVVVPGGLVSSTSEVLYIVTPDEKLF